MTLMTTQPGQPPISTARKSLYLIYAGPDSLRAEIICAHSQNTWLTGKFFAASLSSQGPLLNILSSRTRYFPAQKSTLWHLVNCAGVRTYGGAYAIRISRRVVPSRFYMTFNPSCGSSRKAIVLATSFRRSRLHEPGGDGARSSIPARGASHSAGEGSKMTTIATKTEPRMASRGSQAPATAAAGRISGPEAVPQADLSIAAVGCCRGRRRVGKCDLDLSLQLLTQSPGQQPASDVLHSQGDLV
jgi:hypothetical protein